MSAKLWFDASFDALVRNKNLSNCFHDIYLSGDSKSDNEKTFYWSHNTILGDKNNQ